MLLWESAQFFYKLTMENLIVELAITFLIQYLICDLIYIEEMVRRCQGGPRRGWEPRKKYSPVIVAMPVPILWPQTTIFSIRKAIIIMWHLKYQRKRKESGICNQNEMKITRNL
jgi:hypothetical protein